MSQANKFNLASYWMSGINVRPTSSGGYKRNSGSTAIGPNRNSTTANLYGYTTTSSNAAGFSGKTFATRPSSAGIGRPPGQPGHVLGQSLSSRMASVNNTAAPLVPNVSVLFPQASSGLCASYARPKSSGTYIYLIHLL